MKSRKVYYTMGEVVEMFDVNASLIRHWEGQFDIIKPFRNKKGNRLFTKTDVDNFKLIYHLVKERGMTLDGAKRALKRGCIVEGSAIERDALIMERLQHLRSMLVEMKSALEDREESSVIELDDGSVPSLRGRNDSDREPDAESRELFAFYEQRLF